MKIKNLTLKKKESKKRKMKEKFCQIGTNLCQLKGSPSEREKKRG